MLFVFFSSSGPACIPDTASPKNKGCFNFSTNQHTTQPAQQAVNAALASLGYPALPLPNSRSHHCTARSLFAPRHRELRVPRIQLEGAIHRCSAHASWAAQLPDWWQDLDRTKRLVLVTQGTIANRDLGQVIAPRSSHSVAWKT